MTLHYSDQVQHLGRILSHNLSDTADILRVLKDMNRKANSILCLFHFTDPFSHSCLLFGFIWLFIMVPII